jgi:hypothetical protein
LEDLTVENLKDYETLVFDTGGQLLKLMSEWAKRVNPANGQRDGSLSLKGYGAVGREFENLINRAYYEFDKNIIVVFHAKEEKEGDLFKLRILVEGQTKENVWQPMDLGGFIEMQNNKRVITFANTERHFGKCCHGIPPSIVIPTLNETSPNNFLTWLFGQVNENIRQEAEKCEKLKADYTAVITEITEIIDSVTDALTAKRAAEKMKKVKHQLTSLSESQIMFRKKLEELNLKYDKGSGDYIVKSESVTDNPQSA